MPATRIAIAADSPETVKAGRIIAEQGGNAIDVAVGCALAASLAEVLMCSLGGSAYLAVKPAGGEAVIIDGGDAMPAVPPASAPAWREADVPYGDGIKVNVGHGSIAVPGMLAALEQAWQRYGRIPWKEVIAPVVQMAKEGVVANSTLAAWLDLAGEPIFSVQAASRQSFFPTGSPIRAGQVYRLPDYDQTLEAIAEEGSRVFYQGHIAAAFEREIQGHGGYLRRTDMAGYRAVVRRPLGIRSAGYRLALNPPPSIGGAMLGSMIRMVDHEWNGAADAAAQTLLLARVQAAMLNLRADETHAATGEWSDQRAAQVLEWAWLKRYLHKRLSPHTLHFSVAAADGAAVSVTMSNGYGSGVTIPGTGIACNNSIGEPELNPAGWFSLGPQQRFVSNMAPSIAWNDQGRVIAMGSPGASRITTTIMQGWANLVHKGLDLQRAVSQPRLHVDLRNGRYVVQHEPGIDLSGLPDDLQLRPFETLDMYFGSFNVASCDAQGRVQAVADTRRHGATYQPSQAEA